VKSKTSGTHLKGPIKQWVPKSEIVNTADMPKSKRRLGHGGEWRLISKLSKLQLVKGLPNIDHHSYALFGACQKGKIVKSSLSQPPNL